MLICGRDGLHLAEDLIVADCVVTHRLGGGAVARSAAVRSPW